MENLLFRRHQAARGRNLNRENRGTAATGFLPEPFQM